jgi:hypothetical protein
MYPADYFAGFSSQIFSFGTSKTLSFFTAGTKVK